MIWDVFPEATDTRTYEQLQRAMDAQEPVTFEDYNESLETWVEVRTYPSATGLSVYFTDVTDRRERERELARERDLVEQLLRASPVGTCVLAPDGTFTKVNARAEDILGVSRDHLLDDTYTNPNWDVRDPNGDPLPEEAFPFAIALRTGESTFDHLQTLERPDGSRIWVSVSAAPLTGPEGHVERVVVTFDDVTAQREREAELREERRRFRAVFDGTLDALILADDDGYYVDANPAACDLFELERDELVGSHGSRFAAGDFDFEAAWESFLEEGSMRGEFPLERPDGEGRITEFAATANVLPGYHLSALRDVTERVEAKSQLAAQRDELHRLDRVNRLLRDVNRAIVGEDDRDRIEAAVCRKLVGTDLYAAAFVSRSDRNGGVTVTNAAGLSTETAQGLVESHRLPFDQSILGAYRTNSPTVFAPRGTTESDESAATRLSSLGVRSVGNFPVASEDAVFGVVTLLATDDDAFPVRERTVLTELADIVGKALDDAQTKKLLHATSLLELVFEATGSETVLVRLSVALDAPIRLSGVVPRAEEGYLLYVTIDGEPTADVAGAVTDESVVQSARLVDEETARFELTVSDDPAVHALLAAGGRIYSGRFVDGSGTFSVEVTAETDVRRFTDRVREHAPSHSSPNATSTALGTTCPAERSNPN
ncbi:bacterio-opsin activator domain-containing protein [Haloarculaceae archaeon H-GB2-1]|nr:bacterio-opsin activator domain-containing protein [Haloarculaceae archaeon H-GB2-1]